jgi:hypothetical protein
VKTADIDRRSKNIVIFVSLNHVMVIKLKRDWFQKVY